jgi:hypothetical protein
VKKLLIIFIMLVNIQQLYAIQTTTEEKKLYAEYKPSNWRSSAGINNIDEMVVWTRAGFKINSRSDLPYIERWKRAKYSPKEAAQWQEAGIKAADDVNYCKKYGVKSAEEYIKWKELGVVLNYAYCHKVPKNTTPEEYKAKIEEEKKAELERAKRIVTELEAKEKRRLQQIEEETRLKKERQNAMLLEQKRLDEEREQARSETFKTIVIVILFILAGIVTFIIRMSGYKCPKCGTRTRFYTNKELIKEEYKHTNKDGSKNKRYSDQNNPLISTYKLTIECSNEDCKHVFTELKTENKY